MRAGKAMIFFQLATASSSSAYNSFVCKRSFFPLEGRILVLRCDCHCELVDGHNYFNVTTSVSRPGRRIDVHAHIYIPIRSSASASLPCISGWEKRTSIKMKKDNKDDTVSKTSDTRPCEVGVRVCNNFPQPPLYISFWGVTEDCCILSLLSDRAFLYH